MLCFDYHFTDTSSPEKQNDYRQAKVVGVGATSDFLPAFHRQTAFHWGKGLMDCGMAGKLLCNFEEDDHITTSAAQQHSSSLAELEQPQISQFSFLRSYGFQILDHSIN